LANGDLVGVVDGTSGVSDFQRDGSSRLNIDFPGDGVVRSGIELLKRSSASLATWEDADVVRSASTGPLEKSRLALVKRGWGVDDSTRLSPSGGHEGKEQSSRNDHIVKVKKYAKSACRLCDVCTA